MEKIKLLTDSTSDLSPELLSEFDIAVVPLFVNFGEESYKDGIDITPELLYKKVEELNMLPKTAAYPMEGFVEEFSKWKELGYKIIYMGISKSMSRTYENAFMAAREVDEENIKVFDSMNLSTGIGLQLLKAGKAIREGKSFAEVCAIIENNVAKVRSQFVIPTMEYLYKGGRCSGITKFVGTVLKIKPIIEVRNGAMQVGKKPHGKMKVALDAMLTMLDLDEGKVDPDMIFVTHALNFEDAAYLTLEIEKRYPHTTIYQTSAGCVISSHCGKGTIGILYMLK